jgi:hypothetical protein
VDEVVVTATAEVEGEVVPAASGVVTSVVGVTVGSGAGSMPIVEDVAAIEAATASGAGTRTEEGLSDTLLRTDPTAAEAMRMLTSVATTQATINPTLRFTPPSWCGHPGRGLRDG